MVQPDSQSTPAERALVLQGGGALGAFELGVARAVYGPKSRFHPDVIAGVSIGAITVALLGRPANGDPLQTLEAFWREVTVSTWVPSAYQPYLSMVGVPNFYRANPQGLFGASLYCTDPLRQTLGRLVDLKALADPAATPRLVVTATNLETGELATFPSDKAGLTLDHILASGSLPPSFPATRIASADYWDGGVFDNTPLGAVIDMLDGPDRAILVVNLFPNKGTAPANVTEVGQRFLNLLFANKTKSDIALMKRFNPVAALMDELDALPADSPVKALPGYLAMKAAPPYQRVPHILEVTRERPAEAREGSDFSAAGIKARAEEGEAAALTELARTGFI
ncbi:MAG TPA: patatin-like phospholipase family protein [Caulobacteraceae bacterium]|jgi:predicted acylesterase/phospholipase RssA|nr:patatin-like phospholipase family protein [Caulobacteraceae bacterium]